MRQDRYIIYVPPYEWRIIGPLIIISDYIKSRLRNRQGELSDHHIARMFPVLEKSIREGLPVPTTLAEIMDIFERHFGFTSNEEKERVCEGVARLVDALSRMKKKEPVKVYKLVRGLRVLLIGIVRGRVMIPIVPYEKQSEKEE